MYFKNKLLIIAYQYEWLLSKVPPRIFQKMFNFRSVLRKRQVRCEEYNGNEGFFRFKEGHLCWSTFEKVMGSLSYGGGLSQRGVKIFDAYLLKHLQFTDQDLVIDCGANVGDFYLALQQQQKHLRYHAFEPSPKEFAALQKNVGSHAEGLYNIALSDTNDNSVDFFVSSSGADSSLIEPLHYTHTCKVDKRRLDSMEAFSHQSFRIKLVKVEAEGAEPEVIKGFFGLLDRIDWITADLGFERGRARSSTLIDVTNFLLSNGFTIVDVNFARFIVLFKNTKAKYK